MFADKLSLRGPFWGLVEALSDNFGSLGYLIIGIFVASWLASIAVYQFMGYEKVVT